MGDWLGLKNANVLVAGAGGLGAAVVEGFIGVGANVTVVDRDDARLKELRTGASAGPGSLATTCADLLEENAADSLVNHVAEVNGKLDVLVHCVGVNDRRPVLEITSDDWARVLDANLTTAFTLGKAAGRVMCAQREGRIVFFSSVSSLLAHKNHGPYAASKGGVNQIMRVMAREWAPTGVGVNAVAPGYVETPLTVEHLAGPGVREELEALVPSGRLGRPSEVVGPVLFLASQRSSFVTGQVLYVDGGRTLV